MTNIIIMLCGWILLAQSDAIERQSPGANVVGYRILASFAFVLAAIAAMTGVK